MSDSHDYFADLLDKKEGDGSVASGEPDLMFSEESPVVPLKASSEPVSAPGLPALGLEETRSATPNGPKLQPMGESRGKREARETQEIVEAVMGRFAGGLQLVLENTNRRLEALEDRTEALNQLVLDLGKSVEANTRAAQEQNASIERSFRELARGMQLIRDKQELAETHAELAKLSHRPTARHGSFGGASELAPSPASSIPPAAVQPSAVEQATTLPAPPPPVNTAPPAPSAPPASAPPAPQLQAPAPPPQQQQQQQPQYAAPPPQQAAPAAELQPQYSAPLSAQAAPAAQQLPQLPQQQLPQAAMQAPGQAPPPQQLAPPQQQPYQPGAAPAPPQPHQQQPPLQHYAASPRMDGQSAAPPPPPQFSAPPLPPSSASYSGQEQHPLPQAGYQAPPPPMPQQAQHAALPPQYQRPMPHTPPPHAQRGYEQGAPPPQHAPQPPVPQRAQPAGPPQGLWRGPQPDPYSRPPPSGPAGGLKPAAAPQTRDVPLERVIDEVASMGFSRHEVRDTVVQLMNSGKTVDLNVVLDRLMNRGR